MANMALEPKVNIKYIKKNVLWILKQTPLTFIVYWCKINKGMSNT